jgi:hypothetical protein
MHINDIAHRMRPPRSIDRIVGRRTKWRKVVTVAVQHHVALARQ